MESIKISGSVDKEEIRPLVDKYLSNGKTNLQYENRRQGFSCFISIEEKKLIEDVGIYPQIGILVNDIIMYKYLKAIVKNRTSKNFNGYSEKEEDKIVEIAYSFIMDKDNFVNEKNKILENIKWYLIKNHSMIIDGFVKFRLKKFMYAIDLAIENGVRELEAEKEYDDFISMLQYLMNLEEPKEETVNLIIDKDKYYFLDEDNKEIKEPLIEELEKNLDSEGMSKADLIISVLVVLGPTRLVVHIDKGVEEELIAVISQVFQDKLEICKGCKICKEILHSK